MSGPLQTVPNSFKLLVAGYLLSKFLTVAARKMEKALLYFTLLFVVFSAAVRIGNFEFSVHQHDGLMKWMVLCLTDCAGAKEAMTLEDKRAKIENLQKKLECMQEMSLSVRKELVNPKTQEQLNLEASQNWAARAAEPDVQRDIYASQHPSD